VAVSLTGLSVIQKSFAGCVFVCVSPNLSDLETSKGGGLGPIWPAAPQTRILQPNECSILYGCHDLKRSSNIKSRMIKRFYNLRFCLFSLEIIAGIIIDALYRF